MSSPIAKDKKGTIDSVMINFHKKISHNNRVHLLCKLFLHEIEVLNINKQEISLLDIGCGDMTITNFLSSEKEALTSTGIDIYPNKENWDNYKEFDGKQIPFQDKSFDIALFSDVLHHDYEHIEVLLKGAKRVADFIIIKDHFEYGFYSRKLLQISDIVGNYGYGVSIPKKYLTKERFKSMVDSLELQEINRICPIFLYDQLPLVKFIFKGKYQFISTLKTFKD